MPGLKLAVLINDIPDCTSLRSPGVAPKSRERFAAVAQVSTTTRLPRRR